MKYSVYHAKQPTFGFGDRPIFPKAYKKVADVECYNLDDAFRVTNHIDKDWRTNPEVIESFQDKVRSTSVGDVIVDKDDNKFYCAPVGWEEISNAEAV